MFHPQQPLPVLYRQQPVNRRQPYPNQIFRPIPYLFDRQPNPFPFYVGAIIPPALARQLEHVRNAASAASHAIRVIERLYRKRYDSLCPTTDEEVYANHVRSMGLLLKWKDAFLGPNAAPPFPPPGWQDNPLDQTLAPAPKIPLFLISVAMSEHNYRAYLDDLTQLRNQYLQGAHVQWVAAKRRLEELLIDAPISEMDRRNWLRWWVSYLGGMKVWESRVQEMVPPTWEEISTEVNDLVELAVDVAGPWDRDLSLPVTDETF
ncbi:hypothetical protein VTN77DRAFT_6151 [Rasamsonia byssochlamydoides]|uniref:uncharacterized protein n=1 Tax=Rasamsonia byssochlamydoides TaxID=89139 RepID=UPI003742FF7E